MISIITINLNNLNGLIPTFKSLKLNKHLAFELIVIDGLSTDGSVSFLVKNSSLINKLISEKDNGVYNAMNKGISLSDGKHILFLNSGDTIINPINFNHLLSDCFENDIVYSNIYKSLHDGDITIECKFPEFLSLDYMICFGLPHQATIIKKSLFYKVGFYNENYKIISDWVFFMEALFFHNATYKYVDVTAINFDGSGISNQTKFLRTIIIEQLDYISKRFPFKIDLYKSNSPYVKKYFRTMPRWKRLFKKYLFINYNYI